MQYKEKTSLFRRVPVRFHWSLALLPLLLIGLDLIGARELRGLGNEAIYVALIFASILFHELGHVIAAYFVGIRTREISLHVLGGSARLERHPENGREELIIVLAGPAVNIAIAVVLLALRFSGAIGSDTVASELAVLNLALAIFNMLPLLPLDGGRALRAVLSFVTDHLRATTLAASCGVIGATLLVLFSFQMGAPLVAAVALFLAFGSYVEGKAAVQAFAASASASPSAARQAEGR